MRSTFSMARVRAAGLPTRPSAARVPTGFWAGSRPAPSRGLHGSRKLDRISRRSLGGSLLVDPDVYNADLRAAARAGVLSFGFSAGGCLFPYYIGVTNALQEKGVLRPETRMAGASAGALLVACIKSGMSLQDVTDWCTLLLADFRRHGTLGRCGAAVKESLIQGLPEDAAETCSGRAYISMTKAFPYLKPVTASEFESRDDLISALLASAHIPFWLDGRAFARFRGSLYLDGGVLKLIPTVPDTFGVRVSCFPAARIGTVLRVHISPDEFNPDWPHSLPRMVGWVFNPPSERQVRGLIDAGYDDAAAWMESVGFTIEDLEGESGVDAEAERARPGIRRQFERAKESVPGKHEADDEGEIRPRPPGLPAPSR